MLDINQKLDNIEKLILSWQAMDTPEDYHNAIQFLINKITSIEKEVKEISKIVKQESEIASTQRLQTSYDREALERSKIKRIHPTDNW